MIERKVRQRSSPSDSITRLLSGQIFCFGFQRGSFLTARLYSPPLRSVAPDREKEEREREERERERESGDFISSLNQPSSFPPPFFHFFFFSRTAQSGSMPAVFHLAAVPGYQAPQ